MGIFRDDSDAATHEVVVTSTDVDVRLDTLDDIWGSMKGTITIAPGVDIMEPIGEVWEAEQHFPNPYTGILEQEQG